MNGVGHVVEIQGRNALPFKESPYPRHPNRDKATPFIALPITAQEKSDST